VDMWLLHERGAAAGAASSAGVRLDVAIKKECFAAVTSVADEARGSLPVVRWFPVFRHPAAASTDGGVHGRRRPRTAAS